jgi:tetratricopeptide (TPR) repeat protein
MSETEGQSPAAADAAQAAYEEGRAAFLARDPSAAHVAFERAHRRDPRDPRYMSWYGLTLVLVERNWNLGVVLCDEALRSAGPDPELLLNQARAHLALNQRVRAVQAIERGLQTWPDHAGLVAARDALGLRRPPVISFLSRNNPLNVLLGRIRHRWSQRSVPNYELSPLALGIPAAPEGTEPVRN